MIIQERKKIMQTSFKKSITFLLALLVLVINAFGGTIIPVHAEATWETVGAAGFSTEATWFTSLALDHGTPYVAYVDGNNYSTATVMKFDGNDWTTIGAANFSARYLNDLAFTI